MMKAVYYEEFGPAEVLKYGEQPKPIAGEGQVLVKIAAAAVNPIDRRLRAGELSDYFERTWPIIPGWDFAGRIEAVGPGVIGWEAGQDVAGLAFDWHLHAGTYAEYVNVNASSIAKKPSNLSFVEAAALPLVSLTAWQALVEYGNLSEGQTCLVQAGAGGLGSVALSIANHVGAKVYTTARERNHDYCKQRGAGVCIDYTRVSYYEALNKAEPQGLDVILESLEGEDHARNAILLVKEGGAVPYMNNDPPEIPELHAKRVKTEFIHHRADGEMLQDLMDLFAAGTLKLPEITVLSLGDAVEAHQRSESWSTRGKLAIRITDF